jgi:hypothetical protein
MPDTTKTARPRSVRRVKVGERYVRHLGQVPVEVLVIEDRGNLGVGGRQLVRVRQPIDGGEPGDVREYEMAAEDLMADRAAAKR